MPEQKYIVELARVKDERNAMGRKYGRGERVIMVNGEMWGKTVVTFHGCHGTKYAFEQKHGRLIEEQLPGENYSHLIFVRSEPRTSSTVTEKRVLEKARELVETGKLRHPDILRREAEEAKAAYLKKCAERDAKEEAEFRARAVEAIGLTDDGLVDRIVAAMRWAQHK